MADSEGVDIRKYSIIYKLTDDIQKAMTGMRAVYKEGCHRHSRSARHIQDQGRGLHRGLLRA
ncbi:MAG: hypothetical protein U0559_04630 [Anaerolineae bacterium]